MQFKHPEILWALFLLIIPIIIHFFQLRRFKKTPFTNVKLLKKVVSESRKSSTIKKWLLLFNRLLLLAFLILAFAQPFTSNEVALQTKETVFYLDNSFSMQGKNESGSILQNAVQGFIKNIPDNQIFTLFTNDNVFKSVQIQDIRNKLLDLSSSSTQLSLKEILLKAETYFSDTKEIQRNIVLISDFQQRLGDPPRDTISKPNIHLIRPTFDDFENISIDTVYMGAMVNETIELVAEISTSKNTENTPVSLYNGDKLIAKTSAKFNTNKQAEIRFSIAANTAIEGKLVVSDIGLSYDNQLYFNIDRTEKIKVLAISNTESAFLQRIFTKDEFVFANYDLTDLNYGSIQDQNLIILNELPAIPTGLSTAVKSFVENGGGLVVIPALDLDSASYNQLVSTFFNTTYATKINQEIAIANVAFEHPLFTNVFKKTVADFQYPKVSNYYTLKSNASPALSFQNKAAFLVSRDNVNFFAAPLSAENSNFKNSPLIVPTFYNMGINSLKLSKLYSTLGSFSQIDIPISLPKDNILKVTKENYEFIPQQQSLPKRIRLSFSENPDRDGIFKVNNDGEFLKNISFNYDRAESELVYTDITQMDVMNNYNSLTDFFEETRKANTVNEFWKWFATFTLLFVVIETILQRFLK